MKIMKKILLFLIVLILAISCSKKLKNSESKENISMKNLDNKSIFSFAVMSDNKGDSPTSKIEFKKMTKWIKDADDKFVIGLGDHVKKNWKNDFLPFVKENKWWNANFYPNIADGENEYYGKSQADWGAGRKLLTDCNVAGRKNVIVRKNGAEYYAVINVKGYKIHLIQLHYSDSPKDTKVAFNDDTKRYLMSTLSSIRKGDKDIIIAAAHSRTGSWIEMMNESDRETIMQKVDLVFSATTHFFKRIVPEKYENSGALCLNTGSITYPASYCPPGYLEIHLFENPTRLNIQYIDASKDKREVEWNNYAYIKEISGKIYSPNYREPTEKENPARVIAKISKDMSAENIQDSMSIFLKKKNNADIVALFPRGDLKTGDIQFKDLYEVFPYNNNILILKTTKEILNKVFEGKLPLPSKENISIILDSYNASYIVRKYKINESNIQNLNMTTTEALNKMLIIKPDTGKGI